MWCPSGSWSEECKFSGSNKIHSQHHIIKTIQTTRCDAHFASILTHFCICVFLIVRYSKTYHGITNSNTILVTGARCGKEGDASAELEQCLSSLSTLTLTIWNIVILLMGKLLYISTNTKQKLTVLACWEPPK